MQTGEYRESLNAMQACWNLQCSHPQRVAPAHQAMHYAVVTGREGAFLTPSPPRLLHLISLIYLSSPPPFSAIRDCRKTRIRQPGLAHFLRPHTRARQPHAQVGSPATARTGAVAFSYH
jgi:hypothetical protein